MTTDRTLDQILVDHPTPGTISMVALTGQAITDILGTLTIEFGSSVFVPHTIVFANGERAAILPQTDELCTVNPIKRTPYPAQLTPATLNKVQDALDQL